MVLDSKQTEASSAVKDLFFFKNKIRRHSLLFIKYKVTHSATEEFFRSAFQMQDLGSISFLFCFWNTVSHLVLQQQATTCCKIANYVFKNTVVASGFWEQNSFDIHTACNTPWELGVLNIPPQERNIFWVYFNSDKPEFWLSIYD